MHLGQKFPCSQCEHKSTERRHLKTHKKSVHAGQKFPCHQCEHKATQKGNLQTHINIKSVHHEGQRFPCTNCDFIATTKALSLQLGDVAAAAVHILGLGVQVAQHSLTLDGGRAGVGGMPVEELLLLAAAVVAGLDQLHALAGGHGRSLQHSRAVNEPSAKFSVRECPY